MRIAITDFSSYKAVVVARFLKFSYPQIKIITIDYRSYTKYFHSKYSDKHVVIKANSASDPAYVEQLAELIEQQNIDYLIPINSQELDVLLAARNKFGKSFEKSLAYWGELKDYLSLHDKKQFQKLVSEAGLSIPQSYSSLETAKLPVVFKPTTASSSKGVVYIYNEEERQKLIQKELDNPSAAYVIQQFVEGKGVGFSGFFENGKIKRSHAHKRLAEFPISGGSSVYRGALLDDEKKLVRKAVKDLQKHIAWSGFAMFEFKMNDKGELFFIECNPRIWGSIHQGLANGENYFFELLGEVKNKKSNDGYINTYLSPLFWVSILKYAIKGNFSPAKNFLSNWRNNRVDVGIFRDPIGWLALVFRSFS